MGRPLNKKYFGNRNIGSLATHDNGLGGNQIAGITLNASYLGAYTTRPTITFPDPDYLAIGATTATAVMISEGLTATATGGTGYVAGDLITLTAADGSTAIAYVATTSSGALSAVNFTGTGADRGSFGTLVTAAFTASGVVGVSPRSVSLTGGGTGGSVTISAYRAKSVTMTQKGSGYTTPLITTGTAVTGVSVGMTQATSGTVVFGSSAIIGNNENAIITYAYLPTTTSGGLISGVGGSSAVLGDIVKQRGKITYTVETSQGVGKCKLVSTSTLTTGTMYIQATDSAGGTYYVSKLFSRTAVLTTGTGVQFTSGSRVLWTFDNAVVNKSVKIANA